MFLTENETLYYKTFVPVGKYVFIGETAFALDAKNIIN